jgi:uncharacterized protein YjiS (DUF1127 family)
MTAIHWPHPHALVGQPRARGGPLIRAAGRMLTTLREWRRRVHDRARLAELDERMLKDIGLTHADAEFLINKPFWRE